MPRQARLPSPQPDRLRFAVDLYQGTAEYYDRYRLPYPEAMIEVRAISDIPIEPLDVSDVMRPMGPPQPNFG